MARRVIRYEGEGRLRRPVYEDLGPARAHGDATNSIAAAAVPDRLLPTLGPGEGAGPIERRQATEAQRAAWREEAAERRPLPVAAAPTDAERIAASRARGAERAGFVPGATKPHLVPVTPAPVTPAEHAPRRIPVVEHVAPPAELSIEVVAPCGDCAKADVCRIKPDIPRYAFVPPVELPGITVASLSRLELACEFYLREPDWIPKAFQDARESVTTPPAPTASTAIASAPTRPAEQADASRPLTAKQEQIVDAVRRAGGNMADAGRELGQDTATIRQTIIRIRERGLLPADVTALVDARARKPRAERQAATA